MGKKNMRKGCTDREINQVNIYDLLKDINKTK